MRARGCMRLKKEDGESDKGCRKEEVRRVAEESKKEGAKDAVTCGRFARVQSRILRYMCAMRTRAHESNLSPACQYRVKCRAPWPYTLVHKTRGNLS